MLPFSLFFARDLHMHLLAIPLLLIDYEITIDYGSWQWPKMQKLRLHIHL